jgi:hypothetical protein
MQTKTISIHHEVTINIGNYQHRKIGVGITAEVDEGEAWEAAAEQLGAQVAKTLASEAEPIVNDLYPSDARGWRAQLGIPEPPEPERPLDDLHDDEDEYEDGGEDEDEPEDALADS